MKITLQNSFLPILIPALFFFMFHAESHARQTMGAKSISMGQTGVAMPNFKWATFSNVALMPTDENSISFYGFRYIGISEITDMAATINYQTNFGTLGLGVHRYGFNLFNENRFLIAYKNQLGTFHYGGSVSYTHIYQGGNYGSAGAVGIDLGLAAEVIDDLWFGARATNLNQPAYGDTDEELPRELATGFSYKLSTLSLVTAELVKDVKFPISFRSGIQFEILTSLYARVGVTTQPSTYSFGFGYDTNRFEVNFGLQQHDPLGLSPALDLALRF